MDLIDFIDGNASGNVGFPFYSGNIKNVAKGK